MVEQTALDALEQTPHEQVFEGEPRTVRVALEPGETVAEHTHPGREIVFFVVEGALELTLDDETQVVEGGEILKFSGERRISGEARDGTTVLVVLAEDD